MGLDLRLHVVGDARKSENATNRRWHLVGVHPAGNHNSIHDRTLNFFRRDKLEAPGTRSAGCSGLGWEAVPCRFSIGTRLDC